MRSEEDRRVVLVSLTAKGRKAFRDHQKFHEEMVSDVVNSLSEEEQLILQKALGNLSEFFRTRALCNEAKSEGPRSRKN